MKTWWLKPISITLLFSLGISGIFSALIGTYTNQKWHNFKLETLKRTAVSLALNGNYFENFKSFGPIPEDGSSVYGRFWIVNQFGKVVLSSSSHVVSEDVVKFGIGVSREVMFPIEKKVGSYFSETRFYFLPVPGYSSDTFIVQDLNRGPGKQWFRRVILMLLAHSVGHIVDVVKIGSLTLKSLDSLQQFWIKEITPYETSSVCRRNSVLVTLL